MYPHVPSLKVPRKEGITADGREGGRGTAPAYSGAAGVLIGPSHQSPSHRSRGGAGDQRGKAECDRWAAFFSFEFFRVAALFCQRSLPFFVRATVVRPRGQSTRKSGSPGMAWQTAACWACWRQAGPGPRNFSSHASARYV